MNEEQDKKAIREVIDTWIRATTEGEIDTILGLMAEDVVFLAPGQPPMRGREAFASGFRQMIGKVRIECKADIQEIHIAGDYAFCWNNLSVTIAPITGDPPGRHAGPFRREFTESLKEQLITRRAGPVFSVFRREPNGHWVLFRDANMLTLIEEGRS
jgi:uncharacterized protein (TIGR02246 family)